MPAAAQNDFADVDEARLDEDWSVLRKLRFPEGEIALVAVNEGGVWKVTVDGSTMFEGLEFYGPLPKPALDSAESFVRRLLSEPPSG
jgi:hypothetical protein